MKTGVVTSAIHELTAGDRVAVRAPLGCAFPTDDWKGKNIVLVGGGIGMAPLRSLLFYLLDHRGRLWRSDAGLRRPHARRSLLTPRTAATGKRRADLDFIATIDTACTGWDGCVGLVPSVVEEKAPSPDNSVAVTCGPPIMIKYALQSLDKMGFREEQIYTTLERRMKCGIGLCGRCNLGPKYICTDGPVFSLAELQGAAGRTVDGKGGPMKIKWLGHSCFLITAASGATLLTDPYDTKAYPGTLLYRPLDDPPGIAPDVVTVSHGHCGPWQRRGVVGHAGDRQDARAPAGRRFQHHGRARLSTTPSTAPAAATSSFL